ncbi:MAG: phosphoribosylglycinamide formyltransferase [Acidimicrobiia bacterium]|nr:phosphoribosylglycinamide formyltransferase [Acidimicrobiia bacterium]
MLPIAVLASGSGTNLQALIDSAASDVDFGAEIVVVITDRPESQALQRAANAGIATEVVTFDEHGNRDAFTKALCDAAEDHGAQVLVLAGFMRILAPDAVERFPNRILNIHPSLLPSFPGVDAVEQALNHGAKVTGVTVHFVDEQVDHGPIIAQEPVPILGEDTAESLHERIQQQEHRLYPEVVKALARHRLEVTGRSVEWR